MVHILNYIKKNKLLWPVILLGFIAHMAMIILNGLSFCFLGKCGTYFFGVHAFDMIWHLSLSAVSFSHYPFIVPNYAGATLQGYNYLMDLIVFPFTKLGISNLIIYFKILPLLWFVFFTFSLIRFGLLINKSPKFIALLLFLSYFTASLTYILTLWHTHSLWGSSGLVSMQALQALANMQFAFSLIFILEILVIIKKNILNTRTMLLLSLFLFVNIGLKFYGGILSIFIVGMFLITKIFPVKKESTVFFVYSLIIGLVTILSVILFYNPFSAKDSAGLFSFDFFATVHPMIERSDLLYLPTLADQRYALNGKIGPRLLAIETLTLLAFLFFNYGIRLLGIGYELRKIVQKKIEKWEVLALLTALVATLLNILFVQKGEWWNTVQFLYYGTFLTTIFTAQVLFEFLQTKKRIYIALVFLLIVVSLPANIDLLWAFLNPKAMTYLSQDQKNALHVLNKAPDGVVYVPINDKNVIGKYTYPYPLHSYQDTPYVSAFTNKQVFFSTTLQLHILGIDYANRLKAIQNRDCSLTKGIDYAYIVNDYKLDPFLKKCIDGDPKYDILYHNNLVWIYQKKSIVKKN